MPYLIAFLFLFILNHTMGQTATEIYHRGVEAYHAGHYDEAMEKFNTAIKADDQQAVFYKMRGDCKMRMENTRGALADFNKSEKMGLNTARLYLSRGAAYMRTDQLDAALTDFNTSLQLDSASADGWFNRGSVHYLQYDVKQAVADYTKALKYHPEFADAYYFRGVAKSELKNAGNEGINDIRKAMQLDTSLYEGYLSIAIIQMETKSYQKALNNLNTAIDKKGPYLAEAYYFRAEARYALKDRDGACNDWEEAGMLGDMDAAQTYRDLCIKGKEKKPTRSGHRKAITF